MIYILEFFFHSFHYYGLGDPLLFIEFLHDDLTHVLQSYNGCNSTNHLSVLNTFNISKNQDQFELPFLYLIPKLHNKDALLIPVSALLSLYLLNC
jgi:hypothetical protein